MRVRRRAYAAPIFTSFRASIRTWNIPASWATNFRHRRRRAARQRAGGGRDGLYRAVSLLRPLLGLPQGLTNCCRAISVLGVHEDGGMAEYLAVPEANVVPASGISLDDAAMVEFLAIGAHGVRRARHRR